MDRFITYLYTYEKNEKRRNIGFIKVETAEDTKLEISIRNQGMYEGHGNVYIIYMGEEMPQALKIGELEIKEGVGNTVITVDNEQVENVAGIRIQFGEEYIASSWIEDGTVVTATRYHVICSRDEPVEENDRRADSQPSDTNQENSRIIPVERRENLEKIDMDRLQQLPKKNWYLSHNSFLQHGYQSYNHLMIRTDDDGKKHLGVPGVNNANEKVMASIFGFSEFEPAVPMTREEEKDGAFGYWFCSLEL